jgi:LacI family transcriptional regulator
MPMQRVNSMRMRYPVREGPTMAAKPNVTIYEIARRAGVSASTVSRVLSGQLPVSAEKRAAVLAAVNATGFRPNLMAQALAVGRSRSLGVLTQNIASAVYGEVVRGVERTFREAGFHPLFACGATPEESRGALGLLLSHPVEGLVIIGGQLLDDELSSAAQRVPVVAVGRDVDGLEEHCLRVDNRQGAHEVVGHLLQLGHREIVHLAGLSGYSDALERRAGYESALEEAGLVATRDRLVFGDFDGRSGREGVLGLLDRGVPFSAIFAANDEMAFGACVALFERGIRVPEDVSVTGFDDHPLAALFVPPLTTVRQPMYEMGAAAGQAVLSALGGRSTPLPQLRTELVIRQSTATRQL